MDFDKEKDPLDIDNVKGPNSFLSESTIIEGNEKHSIATVDVTNFFKGDATLQHCNRNAVSSDSTDAPTSISNIYLFPAGSDVEGAEEFTVPDDLQFKQQIFKESERGIGNFSGDISLPLTYYSSVPTSDPAVTSKTVLCNPIKENQNSISTEEGSSPAATNQLSEEMIRSFVVGGNKMSVQSSLNHQTNETIELHEVSLTDEERCLVRVIPSQDDETGQFAAETDNVRKDIIIITNDDPNTTMVDLDSQTEVDSLESTNSLAVEDYPSDDNELSVTILTDKDDLSTSFQPQPNSYPIAEEILQNQPVLCMDFSVEAEIADLNGIILGREITTQTRPKRKPKTPKPKAKVKVILTTDNNHVAASNGNVQYDGKEKRLLISDPNSSEYRRYKCSKCSLRFAKESTLEIHSMCHSSNPEEKRYTCYVCQLVHTQWIKMYNHLFTHGIEKPYKCPQCTFSSLNKSDLTSHMFVHSPTKKWTCSKCSKAFKHRRNMMAHERSCLGLDNSGKPIKPETPDECICHICKKQLSTKRNLEKHYEIHTDVKPFVCNLCGHATRLKESLIMHKRLHTGEKPFKCDQCEYSTPDKSSLRRHKRRHTNEKPYRCKFCDYKSIQKHCLDTHVRRKHTGEQFICGLCHYTTFDRYGLNQHFKQHQQENESETNDGGACTVTTPGSVADHEQSVKMTAAKNVFLRENEQDVPGSNTNKDGDPGIEWPAQMSTMPSFSKASTYDAQTNEVSSLPIVHASPTIELGCAEGALLQQIQQPGDVMYLQENGSILIKKTDGRLLLIQPQEEGSDAENTVISQS